jgi:hypothetical protein
MLQHVGKRGYRRGTLALGTTCIPNKSADGSSPSEGFSPLLSGDLDSAHGGVP